ncbi:Permease, cytosine/purine, uracil, thiamine, allantoin family [Escherichia coli]|nr:Permease, cytosine/purine, uracil, thiamine, allantoin family [Escherichia coli]
MNRPAILKKKAAKDVASVLKIIFLFYFFLIARLKQRYSIREIKRDLWNIREKLFQQRGYSEDLLPKTQSQRTWKTFNYFTLWMGSVHNVPNYVMVGGFFYSRLVYL